jgi:hypothetical protein
MMRAESWNWAAWTPTWRLGRPTLWRDRWRWLARRWAFALGGFAVGFLGVGGWQFEALEVLWESEVQVHDLEAKLKAQGPSQGQGQDKRATSSSALNTPMGPPPVMAWWPVQGTQAEVWPQLERLMAQHGLRLLSLRPEPPSLVGAWPSQAVALKLQGRFDDWVAVWAALNARGPAWGLERLRITPQEGGVSIDAVLRMWLSPAAIGLPKPAEATVPTERIAGSVPLALRAGAGVPVFVATASPPATSSGVAAGLNEEDPLPPSAGNRPRSSTKTPQSRTSALPMAALSPDPAHWPLDQVRLAGVWQQAQGAQLILTAGPHWVHARVGQRIGPDGHVVHGIHAQEVHLRAAHGPVRVIGLEKAKP